LRLSLRNDQQTISPSILCGLPLNARAILLGRKLFPVLVIVLINTAILLMGFVEDVNEIRSVLTEGVSSEPSLANTLNFLAHPVMSSQLLVGLLWLLFYFFFARRAPVVLHKDLLSFRETLQSFIALNTHGCRAPPQVNG
jgi:hypothetical protein